MTCIKILRVSNKVILYFNDLYNKGKQVDPFWTMSREKEETDNRQIIDG